jgi:hypothetical protein
MREKGRVRGREGFKGGMRGDAQTPKQQLLIAAVDQPTRRMGCMIRSLVGPDD